MIKDFTLSTYHYTINNTNSSIITTHKTKPRDRNTQCTKMTFWNYDSILDDETHRAGVWLCGKCEGCLNRRLNKIGYKIRDKLATRTNIDLDGLYLIEFYMNDDLVPMLHKRLKYLLRGIDIDLLFRAENENKTKVIYVTEYAIPSEVLKDLGSVVVGVHQKIDVDTFIDAFAGFVGNKQKGTYRFLGKMYKKPPELELEIPEELEDNKYIQSAVTWVDRVGQLGTTEGAVMKNLKSNECVCGRDSDYHILRTVSEQQFLYGTKVLEEYQTEYDEIRKGVLGHIIDYKQQKLVVN